MAEPLKNLLHPGLVTDMASHVSRVALGFDAERFSALATDGMDTLELMQRAERIKDAFCETLPADYAAAAGILADLGVDRIRLLTNNTNKVSQLTELGLNVVEQVPLLVGVGPNNHQYLETKRDRMGHIIGADELEAALAHGAESTTPAETSIGTDTDTKEHA